MATNCSSKELSKVFFPSLVMTFQSSYKMLMVKTIQGDLSTTPMVIPVFYQTSDSYKIIMGASTVLLPHIKLLLRYLLPSLLLIPEFFALPDAPQHSFSNADAKTPHPLEATDTLDRYIKRDTSSKLAGQRLNSLFL